jgi:hypothetical protein
VPTTQIFLAAATLPASGPLRALALKVLKTARRQSQRFRHEPIVSLISRREGLPNFVLNPTKPSLRSGFRGLTLLRWTRRGSQPLDPSAQPRALATGNVLAFSMRVPPVASVR